MMESTYTRLRAYTIKGGGLSVSYTVDMNFTLIGGRYGDDNKNSIKEEMRIAGCDSIDLLHIPSWDNACCHPDELQMLLNELSPSDIEIPMYYPKDKVGKKSREVIMQYCEESSTVGLKEMTPKVVLNINDNEQRRILASDNNLELPSDNDIVALFNQGLVSVFNTGYVKSKVIVNNILEKKLPKIDVLLLNDGFDSANTVWQDLINKYKPTIIIENKGNGYYKLKGVDLEKMGISTRRTESGDVLITSGVRRINSEIETKEVSDVSGMNYKTESMDKEKNEN